MKITRQAPPASLVQRRGVALIIVLSCLFLLTVIVVAFLSGVGSEIQSSKFYASGSSVKLLAQSATNLVEAEIRDATSDGTLCWASQPGMIRTFGTDGQVQKYYKLYSDDEMVSDRNAAKPFDHTKILVPDGITAVNGSTVPWYKQKGVYVDLNQPILVNGAYQYPIVYGATYAVTNNNTDLAPLPFTTTGATPNTTTPLPSIILPSSSNQVNVLNSLKKTPAGGPSTGLPNGFWLNGNTPVDANATNQAAPMPVKWLYSLQDGSLAVPDTDTSASTTVSFTNSTAKPSQSNPIVGRMAFWTDDESSKVNVNTAAEGTYWDIPRGNTPNTGSTGELTLAQSAPVQYEFQRYPGHPATTSLSTILTVADAEGLYNISPRYGVGGSQEGKFLTTEGIPSVTNTAPVNGTNYTNSSYLAIQPKSNRLYASTDEYLYGITGTTTRSLNSSIPTTTPGSLIVQNPPTISQSFLKQDRFFLTATGRSPDVNLFNRPRVCIWPISSTNDTAHRSVYDQLIAFCSTTSANSGTPFFYYFQRSDPTDPGVDLPRTNDNTGLDRNRRLLEYLRTSTSTSIPGFNGNFATKYNTSNSAHTATDCDQILTEIFDYIRATNLVDPGLSAANAFTKGFSSSYSGGVGQVIPIADVTNDTRGFGRFQTIMGATLLFIANADGDPTQTASQPKDNPVAAGSRRIQAALLVQLFDPSVGAVYDNVNLNMTITGLDQITAGGIAIGNPTVAFHQAYYHSDNGFWGDQLGFLQLLIGNDNTTGSLIGPSIDVPSTTTTFAFSGGTLKLQLQTPVGSTHPGTTVQTVNLKFPAGILPLPQLAPSNVYNYDSNGNQIPATGNFNPHNLRYFNSPPALNMPNMLSGPDSAGNNEPTDGGRIAGVSGGSINDSGVFITQFDVARSVSVSADPRIVAAQTNPNTSLFTAVGYPGNWATGMVNGMHTLYDNGGVPYTGDLQSKLVANANYDGGAGNGNPLVYPGTHANHPGGFGGLGAVITTADVFNPTTGSALNGVAMGTSSAFTTGSIPGDWDTGTGEIRDGPYINKPDEGDAGSKNTYDPTRPTFPYIWKERTGNGNITTSLFSPNREIASAVMFGSLPSEVFANKPWQTLLFRPGPNGHRGLGISSPAGFPDTDVGPPYATPPDHLLLDLFTMPVVEPYAISEPLSTAGRINMNSLIVPFNYINRDTGLRAVLKNEKVISIADTQAATYKVMYQPNGMTNIRYPVNLDATISQFYTRRFNNNDIFRSPSEICDIDIVPSDSSPAADPSPVSAATSANPTRAAMDTYWTSTTAGHRLTGDNARERIYATLYPRLTTKSNTFTVHVRVQSLKQILPPGSAATAWKIWREGTDLVTSEYRGSQLIERYVDPNDSSIPDFADPNNSALTLAPYYHFRVLSTKQFAP